MPNGEDMAGETLSPGQSYRRNPNTARAEKANVGPVATVKYASDEWTPGDDNDNAPPWFGPDDGNPLPTADNSGPLHVAPSFAEAAKGDAFPRVAWTSPPGAEEMTLHLNAALTAWMNTACEAMARLTGDDKYRLQPEATFYEILRLFLVVPPTVQAMEYDTRPGRVARGKTAEADWVDTVDIPATPPNDARSVEDTAPPLPADLAEIGEAETADASEALYEETGEPGDLYAGSEGNAYDEHGE